MNIIMVPKDRMRNNLIKEIKRIFPKIRKPENLASVLLSGMILNAIDIQSGKTRWQFVKNGANLYFFREAYKKYKLLERKTAPRVRFLKYMRGTSPKGNNEIKNSLEYERQGLYAHLSINPKSRGIVAMTLKLSATDMVSIQNEMEQGNVIRQVDVYDKVFQALLSTGQYDKTHNYVWMGFRFPPDKYWLSILGKRMLANC